MFTRPGVRAALVALLATVLLSACGSTADSVPAGLTYSANPGIYEVGIVIAPNLPTGTGGAITSYAVSPTLPPGLVLDAVTGVIGGTPTTPVARAVYTITGTNGSGSTTAALTLGVPGFVAAGIMADSRASPTATLLGSGKVLVAGGKSPTSTWGLSITELYDPATGTFAPAGSMTESRYGHTAVLLPDGKVLVVGGQSSESFFPESAEVYDPTTAIFAPAGNTRAIGPVAAALLPNGKVLVTANGLADLFDPATGVFTPTGNMSTKRSFHTATMLPNGKVLVAGGLNTDSLELLASAELYDPATGSFTPTESMSSPRRNHTAMLLQNGKALVVGGMSGTLSSYEFLASAELYDPATGTFTPTGSMNSPRTNHTATMLLGGKALVAGGTEASGILGRSNSAELYDPTAGTFAAARDMAQHRAKAAAALLADGNVLVVGGPGATAELYLE